VRLVYTRRAARQIDEALNYISGKSPRGAANVRDRIRVTETLLLAHPRAGHVTSRPGVRRLALAPYPYLLDYRVIDDTIFVMRFRHAARGPSREARA
jgi:plasmid stabilization system protein ParE